MALPVIKSVIHCSNFSETVLPFAPQLRALPSIIFESATNLVALRQIYYDTNPLISALSFSLAITPIFLVVSEANKNYSQVDRVWSILPTIYNAHYAFYAIAVGMDSTRNGVVAILSLLWSIRLTYNYYRKGGYSIGSEDYRWAIVKDKVGPTVFFLFNVVFVSVLQSVLLFLVTTPTYLMLLVSRLAKNSGEISSWSFGDSLAAGTILTCVVLSFVSDQQQWDYHQAKSQYRKTAKVPAGYKQEDLDRGFLSTGLFAFSRHPNFAAEQSVWLTLYLWSCTLTKTWYNWTAIGIISYLILFQASTWLTELLSSRKYPEYAVYQKQVGKFIPNLTGKHPTFTATPAENGNEIEAKKKKDDLKARERYNLRH